MTGNISLNENGDRQQGYKIEQIQLTSQFQLTVGISLYNDKTFTLNMIPVTLEIMLSDMKPDVDQFLIKKMYVSNQKHFLNKKERNKNY